MKTIAAVPDSKGFAFHPKGCVAKMHCFTGNHTLHCLDPETNPLSIRNAL